MGVLLLCKGHRWVCYLFVKDTGGCVTSLRKTPGVSLLLVCGVHWLVCCLSVKDTGGCVIFCEGHR